MAKKLHSTSGSGTVRKHTYAPTSAMASTYSYHLDRVDEALLRFGFTSRSYRFAGQGHDLLEDTAETRATILRAGAACWLTAACGV